MKVRRPNAQVIPHDLFNFLMPRVDNLPELKVIFFIAHQTSGRGKEWDWISESQFRLGIVRRRDRKQINEGTGLPLSSIRRGIERALEHEHILRRYTCRSCRNAVEKTETIDRAYKTRHGEGTTKIQEVPERCPHCQNKLRGNYCAEYSLNWLDAEKTTKEPVEVTTTPLVVVPTTPSVVVPTTPVAGGPLPASLRPTTPVVVTEEHTEEHIQKNNNSTVVKSSQSSLPPQKQTALSALKAAGIGESAALRLVEKVDPSRVLQVCLAADLKEGIKDRAAWVVSALNDGWAVRIPRDDDKPKSEEDRLLAAGQYRVKDPRSGEWKSPGEI